MAAGGALHHRQDALPLPTGSWVRARADVEQWIRQAKPGEKLIYAHGPELPRGETSVFVGELYRRGQAELWQPRSSDRHGFDFIVQKRLSSVAAEAAITAEADPATDAILRMLKRAANFGQRCPTDLDLARAAGLATRDMASWRIRKLVKAGMIKVDTIEAGPDARWRTVTIVETKKQTLAPDLTRALKRSTRDIVERDEPGARRHGEGAGGVHGKRRWE